MRILHITAIGFLIPKSGVPAVLKALVEEQNKLEGIEARCASLRSGVEEIGSPYFDEVSEENMESYILNYKPDVAIFHTFFYMKFVKMANVLIKYNVPFIIEPHGSFGHMAMKKGWLKKQIAVHTLFRPMLKKSIGYIYTNSTELKDSVFNKKNKTVVPNGIFEDVVHNAGIKADRDYPIFYYLGRYEIHHKGLDYLISALKKLDEEKETVFVNFYGTGSEEEINFVRIGIKDFKYVKAFEKGPIYDDLKKSSLEDANILLLTSRYEGSPITILDALSYGNACLVTPGTNVANEVVASKIGWKAELDAESIANTIIEAKKEYLADKNGYYNRCKNHVLQNYVWSDLAKFAVEEYKRFLNNK